MSSRFGLRNLLYVCRTYSLAYCQNSVDRPAPTRLARTLSNMVRHMRSMNGFCLELCGAVVDVLINLFVCQCSRYELMYSLSLWIVSSGILFCRQCS